MITRAGFLKATLLAPLAGLLGWKPKPREIDLADMVDENIWFLPEPLWADPDIYGVAMEDVPAGGTGRVRLLTQKEREQEVYRRMLDS